MNNEHVNKRVMYWVFIPLSFLLVLMTGYVSAGPHFGGHGMGKFGMLEKILDHVDLSDLQEEQVEIVLEKYKDQAGYRKGFLMIKEMIALNPEDADYMSQVQLQADQAAEKVKQKVLSLAEARKEIYAILDDEQKQELQELIARKMKRMEKRFNQHD